LKIHWIYSKVDKSVPVEWIREQISKMQKRGFNPHFKEIPDFPHYPCSPKIWNYVTRDLVKEIEEEI